MLRVPFCSYSLVVTDTMDASLDILPWLKYTPTHTATIVVTTFIKTLPTAFMEQAKQAQTMLRLYKNTIAIHDSFDSFYTDMVQKITQLRNYIFGLAPVKQNVDHFSEYQAALEAHEENSERFVLLCSWANDVLDEVAKAVYDFVIRGKKAYDA